MATVEKSLAELVRELPPNLQAEVRDFAEFLLQKRQRSGAEQSALDILAATPGGRAFRSADEVRVYLAGERDAWDR